MSSTTLEVRLKSILLEENGSLDRGGVIKGTNLIDVKLLYPRSGIPALLSIRESKIIDKEELEFNAKSSHGDIIFKESIDGESELTFNVSVETNYVGGVGKFLEKMVGAALEFTDAGKIVNGIVTSILGPVFSHAPEKISVIGAGSLPINSKIKEGLYTIPLTVPDDVKLARVRYDPPPVDKDYFDKIELKKGDSNGEIKVEIVRLEG